MPSPDRPLVRLGTLTRAETEATLQWRYPGRLSTYDVVDTTAASLLDPVNRFHAIRVDGVYVGYVTLGAEARVPGLAPEPGVEDFGLGLAPELIGRGMSRWLLPAIITELRSSGLTRAPTLRAAILDWNLRSRRAAAAAGFRVVAEIANPAGVFLVLVLGPN